MNFLKPNPRLVFAALILSIMIGIASFTASITYVIAQSGAGSLYVEEGVYPSGSSHTIWREGSTYFAKDAFGHVAYSGSNASQLIYNAIEATSPGGTVFIKAANYSCDSTILVDNRYVTVEGENPGTVTGTVLKLADSVNCNLFNLSGATFFTLRDIQLHGNSANNNNGTGIFSGSGSISATADMLIDHCFIRSFGDYGLYLVDCWGAIIRNSYIEGNKATYGSYIGAWNCLIESTTFNYNDHYGLWIAGVGTATIRGCSFTENGKHGLWLNSGTGHVVTGNIFLGNGIDAANTYSGIYVNGGAQNSTISGNSFDGYGAHVAYQSSYTKYGIYCQAEETVITGNSFVNLVVRGVEQVVIGIKCHGNYGYVNENWGLQNSQNGTWITHGLTVGASPKYIGLTVDLDNSNLHTYFLCMSDKNVTHFRIYFYNVTGSSVVSTNLPVRWYAAWQYTG